MMCEHEKIAYEEASHAVIHHHFRREIVEVVATDRGTGYCQLGRGESAVDLQELIKHESLCRSVMGKLAAKYAVKRSGGCIDDGEWRASSDYVQATRLALQLNDGDQQGAERLIAWLERKTELLIAALMPQVSKIAYALLVKEKLSGRDVCEIIAGR